MTLSSAVAGAVDVGGAGKGEVLDIGAERVADRRLHRIGALAGDFRDHVGGVVDAIGVVAVAADHGVGAGAAVGADHCPHKKKAAPPLRVSLPPPPTACCCRCCRMMVLASPLPVPLMSLANSQLRRARPCRASARSPVALDGRCQTVRLFARVVAFPVERPRRHGRRSAPRNRRPPESSAWLRRCEQCVRREHRRGQPPARRAGAAASSTDQDLSADREQLSVEAQRWQHASKVSDRCGVNRSSSVTSLAMCVWPLALKTSSKLRRPGATSSLMDVRTRPHRR